MTTFEYSRIDIDTFGQIMFASDGAAWQTTLEEQEIYIRT
jgi:hypothetical protein